MSIALARKNEAENIKEISEDSSASPLNILSTAEQSDLIFEHYDYAVRLAWSMLRRWRIRIESDDVKSVVHISLCEGARRFDPARNVSFKTFLFYHLRGFLVREVTNCLTHRVQSNALPDVDASEMINPMEHQSALWPFPLVEHRTPEQLMGSRESAKLCYQACLELDELEQEVITRHFIDEEPLKDIAGELDYCRCHISRVKSRAVKKMKNFIAAQADEQIEAEVLATRAAIDRKLYTGGRGRRKHQKELSKRDKLNTRLKHVA